MHAHTHIFFEILLTRMWRIYCSFPAWLVNKFVLAIQLNPIQLFCLYKWHLSFQLGSHFTLLSFTYCYLSLNKNHWFCFLKYNTLHYTHSMECREIHKTSEQVLKLLVNSLGLNMYTPTDTPQQLFFDRPGPGNVWNHKFRIPCKALPSPS